MPSNSNFLLSVDPQRPPEGLAGAVVAIGNFDGVHRGHRAVIARAKALARRLGRPCAVLTFEPHPADYFGAARTIFRLTSRDAKAHRLAELGLDGMFVLTFDAGSGRARRRGLSCATFWCGGSAPARWSSAMISISAPSARARPPFCAKPGRNWDSTVEIVEKVIADEEGSLDAVSSTATREALKLRRRPRRRRPAWPSLVADRAGHPRRQARASAGLSHRQSRRRPVLPAAARDLRRRGRARRAARRTASQGRRQFRPAPDRGQRAAAAGSLYFRFCRRSLRPGHRSFLRRLPAPGTEIRFARSAGRADPPRRGAGAANTGRPTSHDAFASIGVGGFRKVVLAAS